jgi:hypothetical protein
MTITSFRKVLTIALSFVLFPKPFTIQYAISALLVFGKQFDNSGYIDNILCSWNIPAYISQKQETNCEIYLSISMGFSSKNHQDSVRNMCISIKELTKA